MDYEKEQQRLLKLMEEVLEDIEYDDEAEETDDNLEIREEDSESEQDLESDSETDEGEGGPFMLGKDGVTKWQNHVFQRSNSRTRSVNLVKHLPGVKSNFRNYKEPVDIWQLFFNETFMNIVVDNTNKYIEKVKHNYSRERNCKPTNIQEMKALFGLLYISAARKCNHVNASDLFKTDGTSLEIFRLVMSLYRFRFLLAHIRFDDKDTREERQNVDKLAPIRELFECFVVQCKQPYSLSEYVTIDEKLEAFRGNCRFRQYIPSKPNKYGIKIFALVDAKMFYTANLEVYVGTQPPGPFEIDNRPFMLVQRLCEPISGSGRNVTVDNWFTSVELAERLRDNHKLSLLGTIRKNKRQIPPIFLQGKARPAGSSMFGFQQNATMVSYIPKPGKTVLLLSTMHFDDKINEETGKPEMIVDYNKTKGGVDLVDKLSATYNCARPTRRWPMVVFYSIMNIAGINSFVIYTANNPNKNTVRKDFLLRLGFDLVADELKLRAASDYIPRTLRSRISELCGLSQTLPQDEQRVQVTGRCVICSSKKNRKTRFSCRKCKKFLCLDHIEILCETCYNNLNL